MTEPRSLDTTIDAVRRSELRYRTLVEATSAITWSCPPTGLHVEPQPAWMAFTGQTADETLGQGWIRAVHPDDAETAGQRWSQAIASGTPFLNEQRIRRHDGAWRWMRAHAVPVRDARGEIVEWFGVLFDITDSRQAEEALKASELRYRTLHESMRDAFVQVDMEGRIVDCNALYCQMLGYTAEELRRVTYMDLTPQRWHAKEAAIVRDQILPRGYSDVYEKEYRRKDGSVVLVELRAILGRDGQGRPQAMWAMVRDVGARRKGDEALRQMRDMLKEAECIAHMGSFQYEVEDRKLVWSEEEYRIHGLERAGTSLECDDFFAQRIHPDDAAAVRQKFAQAIDGLGVYESTHRIVRPDGTIRWVHDRAHPYMDSDGRLLRYIGATLDVTDLRQMQDALAQDRRQFELAVEAAPIAILMADAGGRIVLTNPELERIFGYEDGELRGRQVEMLVPMSQRERHSQLRDTYLAAPETRRMGRRSRVAGLRKDGSEFPVEVGLSTFALGNADMTVAVVADVSSHEEAISRQHQARLAAEAASEAKTRFLANTSHELRTPLNAVLGINELLRQDGVTPKQSELLDKQRAAGRHLLRVINAILDLAKIESGKDELVTRRFRIEDLVHVVMGMVQEAAGANGLGLSVLVEPGQPEYLGDDTRLQQALLNYVNNAVKFSSTGTITVRVGPVEIGERQVLLQFEVEDQGIGIDSSAAGRLFKPFEQVDSSTTRRFGGTGLGLSITRRIAEMMGGSAGVRSEPGRGCTFWFTARVEKAEPELSPAPHVESPSVGLQQRHAGSRILLAEDDPVSAETAQHILSAAGLRVTAARNGAEAVQLAKNGVFDLILMDLTMPGMDGLEAARRIRKGSRNAQVPIVALTANAISEDRDRCIAAGMEDLVSKPVDSKRMCAAVLKWLDRSRPRRRL